MRLCIFSIIRCRPLSEYVEFFRMFVGGQTPRKEQVLPSGAIELVINLDDDAVHVHDRVHHERYKRSTGHHAVSPRKASAEDSIHFKPLVGFHGAGLYASP
jgi:hypothetical protein